MNSNRPTMLDVAKLADVSVGTVSRVVNNHPAVQEEFRQRVVAAMKQLEFVPNYVAQSMRTRETRTIGCLVPSMAVSFFSQMAFGAEEVLYPEGYTLTITNTREDPGREIEALSFFQSRRVDGIIASIADQTDANTQAALQSITAPLVLIQRKVSPQINSVTTNHYGGVTQAMDFLFALGHEQILMVVGRETTFPAEQSAAAFRDAYKKRGREHNPALLHFCSLTQEEAYRRTHQLLLRESRPTAIIAGSFQMAGVIKALQALALRIPDDVSVISLGETEVTELHNPPLTVLRYDNEEIGRTAAQLILEDLSSGGRRQNPADITMPVDLILRPSCNSVRAARPPSVPRKKAARAAG